MTLFNHEKIQELIDHGYNFDIGKYISDGFEILKKEIGLFIAYTLIVALILGMASMFSSLFQIAAPDSIGLMLTGQFITQILTQLVAPPLMAGYLLVAHKIHNREVVEFGDFFKGFDYFAQLITQAFILLGISILLCIPLLLLIFIMGGFSLFGFEDFGGLQVTIIVLTGLVIFIVYIYVYVSYLFAPSLIIFGDMKAWDAMEASRKIVGKNFWMIFGFGFVMGLLIIGGYIACCIGLLFTLPLIQTSMYAAVKDVLGFDRPENEEDHNDIINHLVD